MKDTMSLNNNDNILSIMRKPVFRLMLFTMITVSLYFMLNRLSKIIGTETSLIFETLWGIISFEILLFLLYIFFSNITESINLMNNPNFITLSFMDELNKRENKNNYLDVTKLRVLNDSSLFNYIDMNIILEAKKINLKSVEILDIGYQILTSNKKYIIYYDKLNKIFFTELNNLNSYTNYSIEKKSDIIKFNIKDTNFLNLSFSDDPLHNEGYKRWVYENKYFGKKGVGYTERFTQYFKDFCVQSNDFIYYTWLYNNEFNTLCERHRNNIDFFLYLYEGFLRQNDYKANRNDVGIEYYNWLKELTTYEMLDFEEDYTIEVMDTDYDEDWGDF